MSPDNVMSVSISCTALAPLLQEIRGLIEGGRTAEMLVSQNKDWPEVIARINNLILAINRQVDQSDSIHIANLTSRAKKNIYDLAFIIGTVDLAQVETFTRLPCIPFAELRLDGFSDLVKTNTPYNKPQSHYCPSHGWYNLNHFDDCPACQTDKAGFIT